MSTREPVSSLLGTIKAAELVEEAALNTVDEIKRLRRENMLLERLTKYLLLKHQVIPADSPVEPIETAIQGEWELVDSENIDSYLVKRASTPKKDMLFRYANHYFSIENDILRMYQIMGSKKHFEVITPLEAQYMADDELLRISFILDNALYTTDLLVGSGCDMGREKRFVKNGLLHIVRKRYGISCTRIYRKIADKREEPIQIPRNSTETSKKNFQVSKTTDLVPDKNALPMNPEIESANRAIDERLRQLEQEENQQQQH